MPEEPLKNREVIFEMVQIGNAVKVTAVDVKTMTEAVFQAPAATPDAILQREALKKLEFVMRKKGLLG